MAINRSSTEYYNLEKVAEVLSVSTAEVNRLREQSKLRGFRDGSNWKFNKEDVHTYLAESIRARSGNGHKPSDSGFDLAGESASASSFDLLMEEAALPADDQLVSAASAHPKSDLDLAALDHDELALAEETQISSLVVPKKAKTPAAVPENNMFQVVPDEDSSALVLGSADSDALDDHESVFEISGSSPQLGLAGDSGFDVLTVGETGNDTDVVLPEEKTETLKPSVVEFELEPPPPALGDDNSESSSQVIAIDVGLAGEAQSADALGQDGFENFLDFDSGVQAPPAASATADPFGSGVSSLPDVFTAPAATVSSKKAAVEKEEYSTGMLIALISALVVMLLPGLMLIDTMIHMWSWSDPFMLNSLLMGTIAGWFGL